MSKRLAIDLLHKASNPNVQSFTDVEPDDDVSIKFVELILKLSISVVVGIEKY